MITVFAVGLGASLATIPADAQINVDRLFPPVVTPGSTAQVKAEGKFPNWPVDVTCDRDWIEVEAESESGCLRVVVSEAAAPGIVWVRLHDQDSASALKPLFVSSVATLLEQETNDQITAANPLELPVMAVGRLAKRGDVDSFQVAVDAGQTLVISAMGHRVFASPMDMVLQLADRRGNVIEQSDDVCGLDPQIVYHADQDRQLVIRVFAFPETPNSTIGFAGSSSYVYALSVTSGPFVDHFLPLIGSTQDPISSLPFGWNLPAKLSVRQSVSTPLSPVVMHAADSVGWQWRPVDSRIRGVSFDSTEGVSASALPVLFAGHVDQLGEIDRFRFEVKRGQKYRATVVSRDFGFQLDSVLELVDAKSGDSLARNDDRSRRDYDAVLEYSAKADGQVELLVSDLLDGFGSRHAYSVLVERVQPTVELSVQSDRFACTAGQSVEIPVTVSRRDGYDKPIRVSVLELPEGVTAESVVSEPQGDSAKAVKLKLTAEASAIFQGPIGVAAYPLDEQGKASGEAIQASYLLRPQVRIESFWLSVAAQK